MNFFRRSLLCRQTASLTIMIVSSLSHHLTGEVFQRKTRKVCVWLLYLEYFYFFRLKDLPQIKIRHSIAEH